MKAKQSNGSRASLSQTHKTLSKEFVTCLCEETGCSKHTPENTTHGSHRVFLWQCSNNHQYKAKVGSRASNSKPTNCARCSGASVPYSTDSFSEKHPVLAKMAVKCLTCKECDIKTITEGSNCVWEFTCSKHHTFASTIYNAARSKNICKACNLGTLAESPLAKEFEKCLCGYCQKGITSHSIQTLTIGSGKKVSWRCQKCENLFTARIVDRFDKEYPARCQNCAPTNFSNREKLVMESLASKLKTKYTGPIKVDGWAYPVDFADSKLKLVIQYDAAYWHQSRVKADKRCVKALQLQGWKVVRIRENPLTNVGGITVKTTSKESVEVLTNKVLQKIGKA